MVIKILQPGLATTVQDRGRTGYYHLGVPQGGAMDQFSYEVGNALVGNMGGEAVLECAYMGPEFEATEPIVIAVTGAPVEVKVNGEPKPTWTRLQLNTGDRVSFGIISAGIRYFIAVAGGIDVPDVLGSRSTFLVSGLGGFKGRKLQTGDVVAAGVPGVFPRRESLDERLLPKFGGDQEVRIVLGLYHHRLTEEGLATITGEPWTLTPVADRTGLRYDGPRVTWKPREQPFGAGSDPSNIVDTGYAVGSIQIPGGNQPIILHRDAVSGGGYATVGTVISADMDLVARAAPGTKTRFIPVDLDEAVEARTSRATELEAALASVTS